MAKIGVVTVTFNSGVVLDGFMQSMLKQKHDDWILYVIDNDSKDNTLELLSTYPQDKIKVVSNKVNYGVAKGNNQGIEAALADECDYVLLLNNDTEFDENLFVVLLDDLIDNNADMSAPKMMYYEPSNLIWCVGGGFVTDSLIINTHYGMNEIDNGQFDQSYVCDYVPTCCVLCKQELFYGNSVGLMDEKYFVYFDDADWMWRAKQQNKKLIYTPRGKLFHKVSSLTGVASDFSYKMVTRNRIYFIRKNFVGMRKIRGLFFLTAFFSFGGIIQFIRGKWSLKKLQFVFSYLIQGFKL